MLTYKVSPSSVYGNAVIPPSKSHTLRAILWASVAEGKSIIHNYLDSPDTATMIYACKQMGASIKKFPKMLEIVGNPLAKFPQHTLVDAGNSGITLRFMTALASVFSKEVTITGSEQLQRRPMTPLIQALTNFGASFQLPSGKNILPFKLSGPLRSAYSDVEGSDSQFASGLAIACSLAEGPSSFTIIDPKERPWFDLSLWWLDKLHLPYSCSDTTYSFPGSSRPQGFSYHVSGDFSSAAFIAAAALLSKVSYPTNLLNLDILDIQGDKVFFSLIKSLGASVDYDNKGIIVSPSLFSGSSIDMDKCIDALPILTVLCCFANSPSYLYNAQSAKNKESDRILTITAELQKMGACIQPTHDGLLINPSPLYGAVLNSHDDHRIAMALTIAALNASGDSYIHNTECVKKTFPNFIHILKSLKANIKEYYENYSMRSTDKRKIIIGKSFG
ncbi:3-phosphoshikimate 1-carboxyvinyltransferase,3-phosphoshikimate 1-carboxyvinyltransferase,5-enolpyruvylshikimate-3-phosphate synthase,3-phosphoshikimate 1-carboxyvinyltransferase,EPSP synthase (3-phosphoshikimate 1-carboxyvinyltransferase) [Chlamydia serpentis]|uniref:3-phosphoshikimate 1-carboxyvinyltransferase n=1 Tax=Chlamydia serpentis TaxID=1967782 RepID=A0A2R8FCJ9_9CHLA|nr:3-phosphoshikimate 1-carboxyvinyltransferase [Chlamydia serpentis]SPN74143.1 3-phosphoshikimate 1-carboxyvinyltransferase,3-phosphoshikimate 1-carboxyvinyltransferase,5-enolpyruvylshikimate-3-phosphate synthase,3-phosphoshikimate 1-carboxyvinyltransferase,EPSP synthase (3-phosphoshikimate 1-carboxyvinyltransferase) [Chlamydia serpentis]